MPSPAQLFNSRDATPRKESRWQILAGLRFLLAMVVVAGHLTWFQQPGESPPVLGLLGGTAAVLGFLIVSGYSIGHSLERRPRGFFGRRLLRIYPLYIAAVLYALVPFISGVDALQAPGNTFPRPQPWTVIGNLLMLQNLVCLPVDSNMLVWTLGIEVICYLFAPLFRKLSTPILLVLVILSAAAFAAYPFTIYRWYHSAHYATFRWGLPLLMFAWAWIAGFLLHRWKTARLVGLAIAVLGVVLVTVNDTYHTPYSAACVGGAALVVTFAGYIPAPYFLGAVLNYLGNLSYPIYLFHLPTFVLGYCIMNIKNIYELTAMALAISAAFLFIESVFKPLLKRLWPGIRSRRRGKADPPHPDDQYRLQRQAQKECPMWKVQVREPFWRPGHIDVGGENRDQQGDQTPAGSFAKRANEQTQTTGDLADAADHDELARRWKPRRDDAPEQTCVCKMVSPRSGEHGGGDDSKDRSRPPGGMGS